MKNFSSKYGSLLIAEIGGNHEGNFDYAKKLTRLAIESKVDVIKYQIYTGDTLVSKLESPIRNNHFKKFELTKAQHIYLAEMVIESGVKYSSSVWDIKALQWLDKYIDIYKIGSGDLTAYPVLEETSKKGKPMIISTGLSSEAEVFDAVKFIQSCNSIYTNKDYLGILQCTSMYPIPFEDANLSVLERFKEIFDLTIGYSDHTEGSKALQYAHAMGAKILEFHFTDSRDNKTFRDHKVSLTKLEIHDLIDEMKLINKLKGNNQKRPLIIENDNGHDISFRRAVYPSRNILKGELLSKENLTVLRPLSGIDSRLYFDILGKVALKDFKMHEKMNLQDLK
jgi:N-acetylneuraminate synthase/N,N'-diacetyllegionaminate synthase